MLFLPDIPGPFSVGAITFITPVQHPRAIGTVKLRNIKSTVPQPALYLEEIAFTAYYPAQVNPEIRKGLDWVIRPVRESLRGFARFTTISRWVLWPVIYLFATLIKIPVYPNAPLLHPANVKSEDLKQWPLVIFSHGLGGSRTAYSQLCSRLAASGKVVLALEHRDGTGHACVPWVRDSTRKSKPIIYYQDDDVILEDNKGTTPLPLRTDQLEFRRQEIYIAYDAFCSFIQNDPSSKLSTVDGVKLNNKSWSFVDSISGKMPICLTENIGLAGHSFGGCTVLSILSTRSPEGHSAIPVNKALVLDPWLEPLPIPGPCPILNTTPSSSVNELVQDKVEGSERNDSCLPRILVMNSETFTLWKDHYTRLEEIIKAWEPEGKRIITLVGSKHTTFSDVPALPLLRTTKTAIFMDVISKLSLAFFDGKLERGLSSTSVRKMEIKIVGKRKDGRPKRKLVGTPGDIIIT